MLKSQLLSSNQRLNDCQTEDSAHVKSGDQGDHVSLIQQALLRIDDALISQADLAASQYGQSTASAVLQYKTTRNIVNAAYQSRADDIVGKMTIQSLDDEMRTLEADVSPPFFGTGLRPLRGRLT